MGDWIAWGLFAAFILFIAANYNRQKADQNRDRQKENEEEE